MAEVVGLENSEEPYPKDFTIVNECSRVTLGIRPTCGHYVEYRFDGTTNSQDMLVARAVKYVRRPCNKCRENLPKTLDTYLSKRIASLWKDFEESTYCEKTGLQTTIHELESIQAMLIGYMES